jgi:hypothetical protein
VLSQFYSLDLLEGKGALIFWPQYLKFFFFFFARATLALGLSVITHPALLTRIVLCGICVIFVVVGALLPIVRTQHGFVRLCTACTGSFGLVLSISLLAHKHAWADVWSRLWIRDGAEWGTTSAERGLSAAYCLLVIAGAVCDWFLRRRFGENPDECWDSYLADYAKSLPNAPGRAGVFHPFVSPLAKLLHRGQHPTDANTVDPTSVPLFSADTKDDLESPITNVKVNSIGIPELATPPPPYPPRLHKSFVAPFASNILSQSPPPFSPPKRPPFLKKRSTKPRIEKSFRKREAVRFRSAEELSSSDSDSDSGPAWSSAGRSSSATLITPLTPPSRVKTDTALEYSDYEDNQDAKDKNAPSSPKRGEPGWSPVFIRKASLARTASSSSRSSSTGGLTTPGSDTRSKTSGLTTPGSGPASTRSSTSAKLAPPGSPLRAVPATPSLIRAIERIERAQGDAYGFPVAHPSNADKPGSPVTMATPETDKEEREEQWARFWKDVKDRAGHHHQG